MRKIDRSDLQRPESGFAKVDASRRNQFTDRVASTGAYQEKAAPARQEPGSNDRAEGTAAPQHAIPLSARAPVWPRVFPGL
jgi:hypothetical protein